MLTTSKGKYQWSKKFGLRKLPTGCIVDNMRLDIGFTPEVSDEEWEAACQRVANLCDEWQWLGPKKNDERLTWPDIMELVAANI